MTTRLSTTGVTTPDGVFTVVSDGSTVVAAGWVDSPEPLLERLRVTVAPSRGVGTGTILAQAVEAVDAYYAGDMDAVRHVPVSQNSGPFHTLVLEALHQVGPGERVSYSELAARAGNPRAARAAAATCAANMSALFIPCHRVVRSDGSLGGFRYGLDVKSSLLERESGWARRAPGKVAPGA